ncbi:hypothetical protein [Orbus hercynius]|uniref:hypothetical protein n=1 Tax=Orbus hercynius TaxID=593135 RepID=UPI00147365AE|nr:hypothetical protein [Orbus hercynius]
MASLLVGCITIHECEGDHKETYNNISPTTQAPDTSATQSSDGNTDEDSQKTNKTKI